MKWQMHLKKAGKSIYAVGNRTHSKAVDFAEKYGVKKVYDDFHEMFSDKKCGHNLHNNTAQHTYRLYDGGDL